MRPHQTFSLVPVTRSDPPAGRCGPRGRKASLSLRTRAVPEPAPAALRPRREELRWTAQAQMPSAGSAVRNWRGGDAPRKSRGEAPKGAPVRVMDRRSLPLRGPALTARRATGCGDPHQRLPALHPLTFSGGTSPGPIVGESERRVQPSPLRKNPAAGRRSIG